MKLLEKLTKAVTETPTEEAAPTTVKKRSVASVEDLPENVRAALPLEAQQIWMWAYNWNYIDEDLNDARAAQAAWDEIRWSGYQKVADGSYVIAKRDSSEDPLQRVVKHDSEQRYSLGVVYEPDVPDTEGDTASADEIEKAAHNFMRLLQNGPTISKSSTPVLTALTKMLKGEEESIEVDVTELLEHLEKGAGLNDQHINTENDHQLGEIVESFIAPVDMTINGQPIAKGAWCLGVVWSPEHWELIKSGERTGLSMEGLGVRTPIVEEE